MTTEDDDEKIKKLSHEEVVGFLKNSELKGFRHNNASISKIYRFAEFQSAIDFIVKVALICEEMNHHPNWTNVYDRVEVDLSTHEVKGVTEKDLELAKAMNKIYSSI